MPNMKKGGSPTTIHILYVSESIYLFIYLCKHYASFYKTFFKTKANAKPNSLNTANEALARSLWIRTHSRHLECELLLDDRLVHLPGCNHAPTPLLFCLIYTIYKYHSYILSFSFFEGRCPHDINLVYFI